MGLDSALCVDFVDEKVSLVVHIETIEKVFHCEANTIEHLFAF